MLEQIATSIRKNKNIRNKKEVDSIVKTINKESYHNPRIFSDIGEDSASVIFGEDLILMTTDRIKTSYIENYPEGAGFSSILVGVDDIYCCGGTPLAASLIISYKDKKKLNLLLKGITKASKKFKVPIIRGHTNPNSTHYELSSTLIGEIKKKNYISAQNAEEGDNIIFALDHEGKVATANDLYWDSVTFKSSEEVLNRRKSMKVIAKEQLAHSAKDVANSGLIGSIIQLCKYSNLGAMIEIQNINIPRILSDNNYNIKKFIKMYLTTSYVLTASKENTDEIISIFKRFKMNALNIGKIIQNQRLIITTGKESINVLKI